MDITNRNNRPGLRPTDPGQSSPTTTGHGKRAHGSPKKKRSLIIAALIIAALLIGLAAWFVLGRTASSTVIDGNKYQAVFFTNGQVYFGKLTQVNGDYMRLENVYYLQNKEQTQDETSPQSASKQDASDVELIKLGNEIHGPEDEMVISKDQVLFFENLKPAGTVSQTITNFQKTKQ